MRHSDHIQRSPDSSCSLPLNAALKSLDKTRRPFILDYSGVDYIKAQLSWQNKSGISPEWDLIKAPASSHGIKGQH